jgi:hypothetical protein
MQAGDPEQDDGRAALTGVRDVHRGESLARTRTGVRSPATVAGMETPGRARAQPDAAEELEVRDELLIACRELLLGVGTSEAAALVDHIDALLDLDDGASPGSSPSPR